jgi:hypothetical protein
MAKQTKSNTPQQSKSGDAAGTNEIVPVKPQTIIEPTDAIVAKADQGDANPGTEASVPGTNETAAPSQGEADAVGDNSVVIVDGDPLQAAAKLLGLADAEELQMRVEISGRVLALNAQAGLGTENFEAMLQLAEDRAARQASDDETVTEITMDKNISLDGIAYEYGRSYPVSAAIAKALGEHNAIRKD